MPDYALLVLTAGRGVGTAAQVLQAGVRGYLDRECDPDDLVRAIERTHAGELMVWSIAANSVQGDR